MVAAAFGYRLLAIDNLSWTAPRVGKDKIASCNVEALVLAGKDAAIVGDVEQQERQEVARVGDSLDT